MELASNKIMQHRFNRQKHEIESFVVRIYRHNLIKDGGIIKKKLREKLFEEIKLRRITRIKMDELGWVLMNHDLISRVQPSPAVDSQQVTPQPPNQFQFNMDRLRELLERHEQRNHGTFTFNQPFDQISSKKAKLQNVEAVQEIHDMVAAKCPLAEIRYVTTIERMAKHKIGPTSDSCIVCRKSFRKTEEYTRHFDQQHGDSFKMNITDDCYLTGQKFEVVQHYDALNPVTLFTIRNTYHTAMHVDCVYLYHTSKQLMPINRDVWPITINPNDTYKFSITTGMFLIPDHDYTILINFNRILDYVEQYHFRVLKEPVELQILHDPLVLGKLGEYPTPAEFVAVFQNDFMLKDSFTPTERKLCETIQSCLQADKFRRLNACNYVEMLQIMNYVEDYSMQQEMSRHNLAEASLRSCGPKRFYSLLFSQFSTAPRCLVEGDYLELSYKRPNKSLKVVIGVVAQICSNKVLFETEEPLKNDIKWNIKFSPNRTPIRMEYQALEYVRKHELSAFFFPVEPPERVPLISRDQFQWFNENVKGNEEQQTAVFSIVNETARPAPYILFGPPGTGKTATLVEAIAQIWKLKPGANVLVTATSNYACNEITERLLRILPKDDILRFFSKQAERMMADMSYKLIECSNLNTGCYRLPSEEELYGKRIVVCTLTSAGKLVQAKVKPKHFRYVFIDECGSATESSALVPIAGVLSSVGNIYGTIVLSGDPKQLGPVTRSECASNMGLDVSMLERLMNYPLYGRNPSSNRYNSNLITKLVKNYRSHKALLQFSNEMFYQNELQPCGAANDTDWALNWNELPTPSFPVIFESTMGKLSREIDSASYFNKQEIELVECYIRKLLTSGINGRDILQPDIGIITPYKKQCVKLKQMCQRHGWNELEIGSVEAFQGREKPVMVLTTVRSGTNGVGFLNNVKRLNVALTRAKALLVVIGNPETLQQDANWFQFIRYCYRHNAIRGVKFELDEQRHQVVESAAKDNYLVQMQQKLDLIIKNMDAVKL